MKTYDVIAEMVDEATDKRHVAGDTFTPHTAKQEERLIKAGCLAEPKAASKGKASK